MTLKDNGAGEAYYRKEGMNAPVVTHGNFLVGLSRTALTFYFHLADFAVTGINHQAFKIRFIDQYFKRLFSYPFISPVNEAPACCFPFAIFRRQITPQRSCPYI